MADKKKNALAELAKNLEFIKIHYAGKLGCVWADKAQRIVAELAKHANINLIPADCYGCALIKTIVDCREIAEEGAGDVA